MGEVSERDAQATIDSIVEQTEKCVINDGGKGKHSYKKDVFIVHSGNFDDDLAKEIYDKLEDKGFRCVAQFDSEAFKPGQPVLDQIIYWVKNSWRTVLVYTDQALDSSWICLEVVLALELSEHETNLRIIAKDIDKNSIPILAHGYLRETDSLVVSFSDNFCDEIIPALYGMFV